MLDLKGSHAKVPVITGEAHYRGLVADPWEYLDEIADDQGWSDL